MQLMQAQYLSTFSTDAASELNVLGHDRNTLCMNCTKVRVLEEANEVSFGGFLESKNSSALESEVGLEILGDLADKSLERELADEEFGGLLVLPDFTEGDGAGAVTVGLLYTTGGGGGLSGGLSGQLLTGGLATCGLACGLLGTSHAVF
jgi:hypothetical protein